MTASNHEMSQSQRRLLEARLTAREREIRADIQRRIEDHLGVTYSDLAGTTHDQGDESVADLAAGIDHAMTEAECAELDSISAALARIAEGSYGTCIDCDAPIDDERLLARPEAIRCTRCQMRHERTFVGANRTSL